jgi:putative acyl-CoA dehydrogenase
MIEQIVWTRLDTLLGTAGIVRRAVAEATWHARHRSAFGAPLAQQPAMRNVLADLALESEAMLAAAMRIVRAFDSDDPHEVAFRRLALAVMKYWVCKRGAPTVAEALECLGGNGYIEEAPLARLYRDVQLGTVWEGSGNVIALDVLRAMRRNPEGVPALMAELEGAAGADPRYDAHLKDLTPSDPSDWEWGARAFVEDLALALQAAVLLRTAPPAVADAFCAGRLGRDRHRAFGTLPRGVDADAIIARALAL